MGKGVYRGIGKNLVGLAIGVPAFVFSGTRQKSITPNKPRSVVVVGAGGHGKVVVSTLQAADVIVDRVYDDNQKLWGTQILGVPVCGPVSQLNDKPGCYSGIVGIGDAVIRKRLVESLSIEWLTAVHPHAFVHHSVRIGQGSVIFAGAVVQPNAIVGEHAIINTCASIDHDCRIGDYVGLGPGTHLSGGVTVQNGSLLGTGCSVLPSVSIGSDVTVGAGTVVIHNVTAGCTIVGAAPRIIQRADHADIHRAA